MRPLCEIVYRWLVCENPPDHTKLRRLVNHAFPVEFVSNRRAGIEAVVASILDQCAERKSFDLIADVAGPISVLALAETMGLPKQDGAQLRRWSTQIAPLMDGTIRPLYMDAAAKAVGETIEYLRPIIEARRARPGDDLISRLARVWEQSDELSESELIATCVFLLTAGHDTTGMLLGNGIIALLENPGELRRLRADPSLATLAVEEFLRFDSPVQLTSRAPVEDIEWGGAMLEKGVGINLMLGSANRDSAQFASADRLDVGRTNNPHLAFGTGIHFCLGAAMARLVTRIAIDQLVRRFPNLALVAGDPVRRPGIVLRGFTSIPVEC